MDFNPKRMKFLEKTEIRCFNPLNKMCTNFLLNNIAVEFHDENFIKNITYKELENAKLEIENILSKIDGSQFIAIDLEMRNFCIPSLILGILSSGRGFLNISPLSSQDLCSRLNVMYLFTQNSIPDTELIHQFNCHEEIIQLLKLKCTHPESTFHKNRFAYAITTSGTTGTSKIIKVPSDCIMHNILDLKNRFSIDDRDKIAQLTALTFDPSIVEIFLALYSNCTLFMASRNLQKNSRNLLQIMDREKVTLFQTTPSLLFARFAKSDLKYGILGGNSNLRILVLGGEPFPKVDVVRSIRDERNQTRIFNIYGITEVSCWASIVEFNEKTKNDISRGFLGDPLSQTIFQVRTEGGKIVEEGEGILFIGSRERICVMHEEINVTLPVFRNTGDKVTIDNTRRVFYKGRNNRIIKRFGNKVDLSKLEKDILKLKSIQNCYAIWDEKEQKLHVCISQVLNYSKHEDKTLKLDVMNHLQNLDNFYRPDEIHLITNFPLTGNGKVCYESLKKLCAENANHHKLSIRNSESIFSDLWKLLAGSFECGFIQSGGNSVAALQIVNTLSEKLDQEFPELLGLLLNDANYSNCLMYIETQMKENDNGENKLEPKIEIFASSSGDVPKNEKFETQTNLINQWDQLSDKCLWQKCRGFTSGENETKNEKIIFPGKKMKLEIIKYFDLKKCIDASPTVFQYSNGKVFATVGSHSGMIITVEINSNLYEKYIIQLPDRIEASILVFDQFRGVVGCYDGNVYCLNLKSGEIFWKFQTGDAVKATAATCLEKKNIFVGSYDRYMYCLSLESGFELWRIKASEGSISGTARLHHETRSLVFGTLNGTCVNLDQVSGNIKWRYSFSDPVFSAPAILETGNVIFASVSGKLACLNIQSGQKLWTYTISGNIFSHLVSVKNRESSPCVLFASRNKILYYLECSLEPNLKLSSIMENPIIATPWNADNIILIACIDGSLQVLDLDSREILASYKLPGEIFSSPVLYRDLIIIGCRDNNLYILKLIT